MDKVFLKNQIVCVTIEDMGTEGEGIGKVDGYTLFVKDALMGDVVRAKIVKPKKTYAYARVEEILTPSPDRTTPRCAYHKSCGGCQLQALSYEKQLSFKEEKIKNNLIRIGGFAPEFIEKITEPIVGMEEPYHYRNKALYPIGTDKEGNPIAGFYAGRTHAIIANTNCYLGAKENEAILEAILAYMKKHHVSAYNEETGQGLIRHVLIRKGFTSQEIMVCLVINLDKKKQAKKGSHPGDFLPAQDDLLSRLTQMLGMTSISVSINTEKTNVAMGKEIHTLWGQEIISDTIHVRDTATDFFYPTGEALTFHISPLSFYQVNPLQTEKLYSLALEYAGLTGRETVWDLYCGIGTISLFMAKKAGKVYGVEIVPQAIADAKENAARNGITNAAFFVGKAEEVLPAMYEKAPDEEAKHPDVIVVDPPRKGCDEKCLETMLAMAPARIVYVSCDSATLARDLRTLCAGGYTLERVRGVDQFGHTSHTEVCVRLRKA